jgi:predicted RecB family nuclease
VANLTKSHFVAGCQCHDLLWWQVHEADAPELAPDLALEDRMEQGREVGKLAREYVPDGVLVEPAGRSMEERVRRTETALAEGAPAVYEASFAADRVFASIDILERVDGGFNLIEVKSTTRFKDEHIPDVALQMHVLQRCGLNVRRAELMHLNSDCRYPDLGDLFVREDVTGPVAEFLPRVPGEIERQLEVLDGEQPGVGFGEHCLVAKECAFRDRCWPELTPDHVLTLYNLRSHKKWSLLEQGIESIQELEDSRGLPKIAQRQVRAVQQGARLIGPGLSRELERFTGRLAFLDFETVSLAIPAWSGCGPWALMPVQFSCHVETQPGHYDHHAFLAESGGDCREELALALVAACGEADSVVAYNMSFERRCIRQLAEAVPSLAGELEEIDTKLVDPLPVVRNYVYDPQFMGSFSLKAVLPALVPELTYDDLEIAEGQTASLWLSRLLFRPGAIPEEDREPLRDALLEYCRQDTWATVRLLEKLRGLAQLEE